MSEKKRILLVEDDKTLRDNTSRFLSMSGFDVYTASDGMSGIQKAIALLPDLILSDIVMPVLNGYDFYKALQQLPATMPIPFIFLSSKSEAHEIRSGMNLGADDYLTKPFDLNELLKVVSVRIAKSERLIKEGENKFISLINNKLTGVFIYKDNNFVLTNRKFQQLTGYSEEELQKINFTDILADCDKDRLIEQINSFQDGLDNEIELHFMLRKKSGENLPVDFFAGVSSSQWKTIITGMVVESMQGQESAIESITETEAGLKNTLNQMSKSYSGNLNDANKIFGTGLLDPLTKRESEVLRLIVNGKTNNEIAGMLFISPRTAEFHRANLLSKTNTKNTAELVSFAIKNQIV